ncbi:subtilisin-like serine protease-like protein PR1A [Cladorrhinum sp. PSN332]|nr:subtilisin-like serine protease-like protein PR1A [Cladorrhinum sp. PSN332]
MLFLSAILVVLFPVTLAAPFTEPSHVARRAPLGSARSGKTIPGQYIVKFKDSASSDAVLSAANGKLKPSHVFKGPFKGFAGHLDAASLDAIRKLPEVEFIEEDAVITLADDLTVPGTGTGTAPRAIVTQAGAPWNLARLSNPTPGSNIYRYDSSAGAGTCSYVIATGIQVTHTQFGGRAIFGANFAGDGSNTDGDGNGHGTNIAGIIGSTSYGVARQTRLIAVKVLNAAAHSQLSWRCRASITLGGSASAAINTAVRNLVLGNVFVAVSSGTNNATIATSPANEPLACTVGSTTQANGTLTSAAFGAAHVAGLGAYLLGLPSSLTGSGLCAHMQSIAIPGVLTGVPPNTVNLLAHNGWDLP